jgi:hypothetical protein
MYAHCAREFDVNPETLKTRYRRCPSQDAAKNGHARQRLLGDAEDLLVALWRLGCRTGLPPARFQVIDQAALVAAALKEQLPLDQQSKALQAWDESSEMRSWFNHMIKREGRSTAGALILKKPNPLSSSRKACATEGTITPFKNNIIDPLLADGTHAGMGICDVGNWDEWHCDRMAVLLRGKVMGEAGNQAYQVTDGEKDVHISALTLFIGTWIAPMVFIFSADGDANRNWLAG